MKFKLPPAPRVSTGYAVSVVNINLPSAEVIRARTA